MGQQFSGDFTSTGSSEPTGGIDPLLLYDITLEIDGALIPGATAVVIAQVTANLPALGTQNRLSLPEVESARGLLIPEDFRVPLDVPIPAVVEQAVPLGAGQAIEMGATVPILLPGPRTATLTTFTYPAVTGAP